MNTTSKYLKAIALMDSEERLEQAKKIIHHLTAQAVELVHLHESNQLLVRSKQVTNKVQDGRAARALNITRIACARYEVIRLLAMWDPPQQDATSIPTAIELLDDERVVRLVHVATYKAHAAVEPRILNTDDDPELQEAVRRAVRSSQEVFAREQAQKAEVSTQRAIKTAKEHVASDTLVAVSNLRNHLAHALLRTRAERNGYQSAPIDARRVATLLRDSVSLVEEMYCWVNGTSFDISGEVSNQAKRYADSLWNNISFAAED